MNYLIKALTIIVISHSKIPHSFYNVIEKYDYHEKIITFIVGIIRRSTRVSIFICRVFYLISNTLCEKHIIYLLKILR
jgi:hypothetical protein